MYIFVTMKKETVMVVINNNPQSQILNVSRFQENIKSFTKGKDVLSGKEISLKRNFLSKGNRL